MRSSFLRRLAPWCGVWLATAAWLGCAWPGAAQQAAGADKQLHQSFVREFDEAAQKDAQGALALLRQFVDDHPDLSQDELLIVYQDSASSLYRRSRSQLEGALQLLEEAKSRFPKGSLRYGLISEQASLLRRAKRLDEAAALMQENWPAALAPNFSQTRRQEMLGEYVKVLQAQNQPDAAQAVLEQALERSWRILQWQEFHEMMVEVLAAQGRETQALSWAKLNFGLASFRAKDIASATRQLTQLWLRDANSAKAIRAFEAAQKEASAPNPLDEVALPVWPAALGKELEAATKGGVPQRRLAALIALGRTREAMVQAHEALMRDPASPAALEQVAWVFKAADSDVARANAFVSYYNEGEGENPMVAFLAETETGGTATQRR